MSLPQLDSHIHYYPDFESREAAFNRLVADLIPCRYAGPVRFWRDFSRIMESVDTADPHFEMAYISSNPSDCLAFGTSRQVLSAARMTAGASATGGIPSVEEVAHTYHLEDHLTQPIRSLSGGETVKLALAKAALSRYAGWNLVVSSPFCWLAHDNLPLLNRLVDQFANHDQVVSILALEGEDQDGPASIDLELADEDRTLDLNLISKDSMVGLGADAPGFDRPAAMARIRDVRLSLRSPVLLVGDNGQGKSVLAKALAGALPVTGRLQLSTQQKSGRARLLFQDVITQTFLRQPATLALHPDPRIQTSIGERSLALMKAFDQCRKRTSQMNPQPAFPMSDPVADGASLLAIKIALVAVRLAASPVALILDEPDWGLSRLDAVAFVGAVIKVAHGLGLPVLVISHKKWWVHLAATRLVVKKHPLDQGPHQGLRFEIVLEQIP